MKQTVASVATKFFPGLLGFAASDNARRAVRLSVADDHIDIIRKADQATIRINRLNAVYAVDMMNCFEYYFGSVRPETAQDTRRSFEIVDFSRERFQNVVGFDDFPILCPSLAEPFVTTRQYLDMANLQAGDIVLDLGSYCGLTSIAFSKAVGQKGRVLSLEPDPRNFRAAAVNVEAHRVANGLANIELRQMAVAGRTGDLLLSAEGAMGSADVELIGRYRGGCIRVAARTLTDLAEQAQLAKVNFVKMDIEGSEESVIAASEPFFRRYRPTIVIEPHMVNGTLSDKAVRGLLMRFGYSCATIEQTGVSLPLVVARPLP